jgi:tetratricopeptide (TPR) repeat protein
LRYPSVARENSSKGLIIVDFASFLVECRIALWRKKYNTMTRSVRLAARCAALLFLLACTVATSRADEIEDINRLVKQGQHAQALERVNRYLAQKPRDPQGRFIKGLILAEQNKVADAIEVFTKLSQDYPELPEPFNNLAVLFAGQGQFEKARQQLELSIRTHPSYATAYENLGDVYTKLASQAYDKALQLDSSNSAAQNKLSMIRDLISGGNRLPAASGGSAVALGGGQAPAAVSAVPAKAAPDAKQAIERAKPAAGAAETREQSGNAEEVLQVVRAWAGAWSRRSTETYLAFYAKDFKTPNGETRNQWEESRKQRISAPKQIEVAIESPKVTFRGDKSAVVTFRQLYRSDNLKVSSRKTLLMVRDDGRWVIQQERSGS